ncbi:MAG: NAD(P)-dependent oxidoreductase [Paenibacillaceae bacterium]
MSYLVTGGSGFLGRTLVRILTERGENVVSYDRKIFEDQKYPFAQIQGDLSDLPTLLETIRTHRVERIIHTAAISHPYYSRDIPYQTVLTNALGTTHIFEAARLSGIKRVVNLSSECVYGNNNELNIVHESASLHPTTPYGATKVFTEKLAAVYTDLYGMEIPSLRPGWIYGPGQIMQCYMKNLFRNAIDGIPTYEEKGRDYRFQYVHVSDVAEACILAATASGLKNYVYNVTAGTQISYADLEQYVKELFPEAEIDIGEGTIDVLDANAIFDISLAKQELGYAPKIELKNGMAQYAQWLRTNDY